MIARLALWIDDRLGTAHWVSKALKKAFPDHWSFMLGEINMYAFIILLATGTFMALFYQTSTSTVIYHGPYVVLNGTPVSQAFASVLNLSFQVNAGLLIRQTHHWAALIFIAGIIAHMCRIFFTGAFRRPRELNWLIGIVLFILALGEGFTGYSLPGDLLSGLGMRIFNSVLLSIPVVGTWLSFLIWAGNFPTDQMLQRLFVFHVFVLPATIAALVGAHLALLWRQKHSQFRGPGRTEHNVVGSPLFPLYAAKSMALFAAVIAVCVGLGAFVQINPIWLWGSYVPWRAFSPLQPDWYIGWLEGALRIGPPFALHIGGDTIPSPFWASVLVPTLMLVLVVLVPWIDKIARRDPKPHQLLDAARDVPARTAAGIAFLVFAGGLTLAGGDDVQARYFHVAVTSIVAFYQGFCTIGVALSFAIAYAIAAELRARHGQKRAPRLRLRRNERGGFDEERIP
ncbi:MAG: cytochrome bc1 complex cytochrome b subunit [Candidatus Tyrphobacter sp.]